MLHQPVTSSHTIFCGDASNATSFLWPRTTIGESSPTRHCNRASSLASSPGSHLSKLFCLQPLLNVEVYFHPALSVEEVPEGRRRTRHFSGTSTSLSRHGGGGCEQETFAAIDSLKKASEAEGILMGEMALSWLLAQPQVVSVIVGASRPSQVTANAKLVAMSPALLSECSRATEVLKQALGDNPDMWAQTSRVS